MCQYRKMRDLIWKIKVSNTFKSLNFITTTTLFLRKKSYNHYALTFNIANMWMLEELILLFLLCKQKQTCFQSTDATDYILGNLTASYSRSQTEDRLKQLPCLTRTHNYTWRPLNICTISFWFLWLSTYTLFKSHYYSARLHVSLGKFNIWIKTRDFHSVIKATTNSESKLKSFQTRSNFFSWQLYLTRKAFSIKDGLQCLCYNY